MLELKPKKFNARRAWEEGETEMIRISEAAAKKLKETIAKQKNSQNTMLRIDFGGYGWGGPKLQLTLDELKDEHDTVVESQGIPIVYNSGIDEYLQNVMVDYSNSWFERGFVIKGSGLSSC